VANGERFDRQLLRDRSDVFEGGFHAKIREHEGAVRLLSYFNRFDGGAYADAIRRAQATGAQPDITIGPKPGTLKYGFGVSADQEILKDLGVFGRLGWNDGKTESFAFTAMDRLATLGVSLNGSRWHRPGDTAATALTVGGLSAVHAQYLAMGGYDFLIGDGALRYGPETSWETYYSVRVMPFLFATFGLDHVDNPAYNRDRGPVWIGSFRLHVETGKK
jgi:carbohydrate-selective porin OprB